MPDLTRQPEPPGTQWIQTEQEQHPARRQDAGEFRLDPAAGAQHVDDMAGHDQLHAVILERQAVRKAAQVPGQAVAMPVQAGPFRMARYRAGLAYRQRVDRQPRPRRHERRTRARQVPLAGQQMLQFDKLEDTARHKMHGP